MPSDLIEREAALNAIASISGWSPYPFGSAEGKAWIIGRTSALEEADGAIKSLPADPSPALGAAAMQGAAADLADSNVLTEEAELSGVTWLRQIPQILAEEIRTLPSPADLLAEARRVHPKCATCVYWMESGEWDTPPGFKRCTLAPMSSEITTWDDDNDQNVLRPEYAAAMISAMDGSSYKAHVHTRGDFYCPQHSALTPVDADQKGNPDDKGS